MDDHYNNNFENSPNKRDSKDFNRPPIDKDLSAIRNENKELKENNARLIEKLRELEKKVKISNIKLDEVIYN